MARLKQHFGQVDRQNVATKVGRGEMSVPSDKLNERRVLVAPLASSVNQLTNHKGTNAWKALSRAVKYYFEL